MYLFFDIFFANFSVGFCAPNTWVGSSLADIASQRNASQYITNLLTACPWPSLVTSQQQPAPEGLEERIEKLDGILKAQIQAHVDLVEGQSHTYSLPFLAFSAAIVAGLLWPAPRKSSEKCRGLSHPAMMPCNPLLNWTGSQKILGEIKNHFYTPWLSPRSFKKLPESTLKENLAEVTSQQHSPTVSTLLGIGIHSF